MSADLRVAVLSDVHGNLEGLKAVLADIHRNGPFDSVIAAGDYCVKGPDPAECIDVVLEQSDEALIGNTDIDVLSADLDDPEFGRKKRSAIAWTREQLGDDRICLLRKLPFRSDVVAPDGSTLTVVHANPHDTVRHIFPDMEATELNDLLAGLESNVLVFGHLHIPYRREYGRLQLFDIAAVGLPQDGDRRAVWGAFDWAAKAGWRGTINRVEYDYSATVLRMIESEIPHTVRRIQELVSASYV